MIHEIYVMRNNVTKESIEKLTETMKKLDEKTLLETIETVENWNFKLTIDYKRIFLEGE